MSFDRSEKVFETETEVANRSEHRLEAEKGSAASWTKTKTALLPNPEMYSGFTRRMTWDRSGHCFSSNDEDCATDEAVVFSELE